MEDVTKATGNHDNSDNSNTSPKVQHGPILGKCEKIPAETAKKALEELGETEKGVAEGLAALRAFLKEKEEKKEGESIQKRFGAADGAFLLRFLRARKFDVKRTYKLMKGYVSFREKYPELTENLTKDVVKNTLENGFPGMLPIRDHQGRIVLLFAIGNWDAAKFPFDVVLQGYIFLLEKLLENAETQINGFVIVENFKNYSISQALSMRPSQLKKMVDMLQGSFPARFKGIHFIYQPWYFTWTYNLCRPFLRGKLLQRVHIHGWNLERFFEEFDPDLIPEDYGGNAPPYDPVAVTTALFAAIENETLSPEVCLEEKMENLII